MKLTNKTLAIQAREIIREMVEKAEFMSRLPSEQELAEQLGVSRNTIREALKALEAEGMLVSRQGIGTFVIHNHGDHTIKYNFSTLESTTQIIESHGFKPGMENVYSDRRLVDGCIANLLKKEDSLWVLYIERVRTADGQPLVFVEDYIPYEEGMLEAYQSASHPSLFDFLRTYTPVIFSNCSVHAVLSDQRLMQKLNLQEPKALLLLRQLHYSDKGIPVLYSDSYFITDKLEFNLVRRRL